LRFMLPFRCSFEGRNPRDSHTVVDTDRPTTTTSILQVLFDPSDSTSGGPTGCLGANSPVNSEIVLDCMLRDTSRPRVELSLENKTREKALGDEMRENEALEDFMKADTAFPTYDWPRPSQPALWHVSQLSKWLHSASHIPHRSMEQL